MLSIVPINFAFTAAHIVEGAGIVESPSMWSMTHSLRSAKASKRASNLLFEYGFGGLRKGELFNVIIDHIKLKLFNGKNLSDVTKEEIEIVLDNLDEIRENFTQPIVQGILGGKDADK